MIVDELREKVAASVTQKGGGISHTTGKKIMLFPFTTSSGKADVYREILKKNTFVALVIRQLCGLKLSKSVNCEDVEKQITKDVDTDNSKDLKHILRCIAFDQSGELLPFCEKALLYVGGGRQADIEKLGNHFFKLYLNDSGECLKNKLQNQSADIFHQLILKSFPSLERMIPKLDEQHYPVSKRLKACFVVDLNNLSSRHKLKIQDLKRLFVYYLFAHQVDITLRFNRIIQGTEGDDIPLYTMEWEKVSASREGYIGGWKRIDQCRNELFRMAVCSELMNYTTIAQDKGPMGYSEWAQISKEIDSEQKKQLEDELDIICDEYRRRISDIDWEAFRLARPSGIVERLKFLHYMVDYQFQNSNSRDDAAKRYNNWLLNFAKENFLKSRGRIGYTLTLTRDWFLFLSSLCAQSHGGRIRVYDFWEELNKRGIGIDHDSKLSAVSLLNRLGLLEKKSDSGDAQYVRSFI